MTDALGPRVVIITRETDYELLLNRHATTGAARFYLRSRHQTIDETEQRHLAQKAAVAELKAAIPREWRVAEVRRSDLDRFIFAPEDIVVAVGQDGLVANVAKYLSGQSVIGVNPEPDRNPGILVPHSVGGAAKLLVPASQGKIATEDRTMLRAQLDSGQALLALNEVFVGHATHQSARYVISYGEREEAQSSSGLIVASGTGATGWALSIGRATGFDVDLTPVERAAVFLVREPWPSRATGVSVVAGRLGPAEALRVVSRMNESGVVFADGMEQDRLPFGWGAALLVRVADERLRLVPGEHGPAPLRRTAPARASVPPAGQPVAPPPRPASPVLAVPVRAAPKPSPAPKPKAAQKSSFRLAALRNIFVAAAALGGLGKLIDLGGTALGFLAADPVVYWSADTAQVGLLGVPLAWIVQWRRRRAHGQGFSWWTLLAIAIAMWIGLALASSALITVLAGAGRYAACPALDHVKAPKFRDIDPEPSVTAAAYARPGQCDKDG